MKGFDLRPLFILAIQTAWINEWSCKPGAISRFQRHSQLWQITM